MMKLSVAEHRMGERLCVEEGMVWERFCGFLERENRIEEREDGNMRGRQFDESEKERDRMPLYMRRRWKAKRWHFSKKTVKKNKIGEHNKKLKNCFGPVCT